jgi:hypothetical protein
MENVPLHPPPLFRQNVLNLPQLDPNGVPVPPAGNDLLDNAQPVPPAVVLPADNDLLDNDHPVPPAGNGPVGNA